jgi:uncharacterized protein
VSLLTVPVLPRSVGQALASDRLHLILMPTERCNFRCSYCYEDFRLGRMDGKVVLGIERLLSNRAPALRSLVISWFGGEPLLARDVVLRVLRHVAALRTRHKDLSFSSDITTNGYLLDVPIFEELYALGVEQYQVSFDGLDEEHDRKRPTIGGRGTFLRIWRNLLEIRALPNAAVLPIRLHVDRTNVEHCRSFMDRLVVDMGRDARFPLFFKLLGRWGGPGDERLNVFDETEGREALRYLADYARAIGVPLHRVDDDVICYAARRNSLLIRSDGRINKCTLALEAPENQVGWIGEDGRLHIDDARMTPWLRGLWSGSPEALHCPMTGLVSRGTVVESA